MSWFARLLTVALVVVLGDAASASVHGPPAGLAAAVAGAVLAAAGLAVFWSRPWIAAGAGLTMLAGAFAAGTPAASAGGPALTGLSPSDAAALVFAVCIAWAAAAVAVALPDVRVRTVVCAVAAFAIVATAAAIGHGGLPAAFVAAPLAWTRGTYLAAELLLPLATLILIVYGLRHFTLKRAANGVAALVLACGLAAATQLGASTAGAQGLPTIVAFEHPAPAVSSLGTPAGGAPAAQIPPGAGPDQPAVSGPPFVPSGSANVPPEVAAAAATVAKTPQQALATVAAYADDLYAGALGGSAGALRAHSGNSIDKALLLRDLLRAGSPGVETAFARCTLSDDQADAVVARTRSSAPHAPILLQAAGAEAQRTGDPAARARVQMMAAAWTRLVGDARDEGKKLASRLQTAGVALPAPPGPERLRALAADHVWLRAKLAGAWTDLDPTVAPAALGKTRCSAQTQTAGLPAELYDVLGVSVVAEEGGATPQLQTLLARTFRTADLGDRDLSFAFAEPLGLSAAIPAGSPSPPPGTELFTPVLQIANEDVSGTPLTLPPFVAGSIGKAAAAPVNAAAAAFGDASAAPSPAASPSPALPVVSAVWLELHVWAPGGGVTTVRSPIFDRVGYAARASRATPPPLGAQLGFNDYRSLQTVWNVAVSGGHVASAAGPANVALGATTPVGVGLARLNGAYFQLRRALMDDARGSSVGVAATAPGISLLAMDNAPGLTVDIAGDSTIPLTADETRPLWAASSVLAERRLVTAPLKADSAVTPARDDALFAFDYASAGGMQLVALHPGDLAPAAAAIPADARARMSDQLQGGASLLALAPDAAHGTGPTTYAFWIVDPRTGTVRDENANGRHTEAGEYGETNEVPVKSASTIRRLACRVLFAAMVWSAQDSSWAEGQSFKDAEAAAEKAVDEDDPACG
jgi:hypothetical protein